MSATKKDNNIFGVDVKSIIKDSLKTQTKDIVAESDLLEEAYVHEPKQFKQVTEFLSEKAKMAHVELYKGYIDSFNKSSTKLDSVDRSASNSRHSDYRSLKLDETYNLNGTWLHELYFSNCFDPHSEIVMDSLSFLRLQRDFGTFEDWQRDFIAAGLSSRNGWVVTGFNMFLKRYVNTVINHHSSDVMVGLFPVIVVDMWEHSYFRDYLTDKKSYMMSQMKEFNWTVIEERFKKSEAISLVLK
jgi:Fe-Mn family superoxide dismutase